MDARSGIQRTYAPRIFDSLRVLGGRELCYDDPVTGRAVAIQRHPQLVEDDPRDLLARLVQAYRAKSAG